ncbi:hypothetical protein OS493_024811 [Desmophyllum pertusum]|uniref:Uncharacterized protein n=1 Tax=Desmophyllum pertusum TaxID=174260 RepID=A0A9X0CWH8_9CNID|nr:hypothetical protein OS493_024811 [Desmophyllum pertusum]
MLQLVNFIVVSNRAGINEVNAGIAKITAYTQQNIAKNFTLVRVQKFKRIANEEEAVNCCCSENIDRSWWQGGTVGSEPFCRKHRFVEVVVALGACDTKVSGMDTEQDQDIRYSELHHEKVH